MSLRKKRRKLQRWVKYFQPYLNNDGVMVPWGMRRALHEIALLTEHGYTDEWMCKADPRR